MKIWSMMQVLSQEKEKKKIPRMISRRICAPVGRSKEWGRGLKRAKEGCKKPQICKGSVWFMWGCVQIHLPREYFLSPAPCEVTTVPPPRVALQIWGFGDFGDFSRGRCEVKAPPLSWLHLHQSQIESEWPPSASNLTCKGNVHIWPVNSDSGRLCPAPDVEKKNVWLRLVSSKVKGHSKTKQECAIKVTAYSKLCWSDCWFCHPLPVQWFPWQQ